MNNIPDSIPFSAVDPGVRARTQHLSIDELADDIEVSGLIQPIVLAEKTPNLTLAYELEFQITLDPSAPYLLTAGGRRWHALSLLETPTLYHASTSDPLRPGFVLRGEAPLVDQLILEAKENQNREDIDWRDQLRLIVRTWRLAKREADERGQAISAAIFGVSLGVNKATMTIADKIYDHFQAFPDKYKDALSIYQGLSIYTKDVADELTRVAVARSYQVKEEKPSGAAPVSTQPRPQPSEHLMRLGQILEPGGSLVVTETIKDHVIPLSQSFLNTDGIAFMEQAGGSFCDHIICDPDYALDVSVLDSHHNNRPGIMGEGVRQKSVADSLRELYHFIELAWNALPDSGFLIFWYALDHHEKIKTVCEKTGFTVQPWPCTWLKLDYRGRSNSAPNQNFPKSCEYAMCCRKPGTVLAKVQNSNVFSTDALSVTKILGHAFAKPFELWRWLYQAVSVPGQIVFDPFCGSGSSAIAAIRFGLRPIGCEIDEDIYNRLIINLQNEYRSILKNPNVRFS